RVLADAAQGQAVWRVNDSSTDQKTDKKNQERVCVGSPAEHVEAEAEHDGNAKALQALGAAGQHARAVRRLVQQQAEAQGEHDKREVAEAHDYVAQRVTKYCRRNTCY